MIPLTHQQARALDLIREANARGTSPTFEELREHLGLASKSGVARLLDGMEQRGAVRRMWHRPRALEAVDSPRSREEICAGLASLESADLRHVIAHAAGLAAHRDCDGGALVAKALRNIADRLTGQPRKAAA